MIVRKVVGYCTGTGWYLENSIVLFFLMTCPLAEKMPLFNLHLFEGIKTEWDRLYGTDGGVLQRTQENSLAAFLKIYDPEKMEGLHAEAGVLLSPRSVEANEEAKQLKMEKLPETCYPCIGSRFVWEAGSVRKMRDFKAALKIHVREKIGSHKALSIKLEEAPVNGDRVIEVMISLPNSLEECAVAGRARQAIAQSTRISGAPKWGSQYVRLFNSQCQEVPGIFISITSPKSKDAKAFQDMVYRSFPELAGGQIQEWKQGFKKVWSTDQNGIARS